MCGIWGCIGKCSQSEANTCTRSLLPRGPESYSVKSYSDDQITFGFTRLAINDLTDAGMQPMSFDGIHWICNGEIYNYKDLETRYELKTHSGSDCSILGELWIKLGRCSQTFFRALDGVFAIAIYDEENDIVTFGRDPYGVRPLFMGFTETCTYFGSEMKSIPTKCSVVKSFPPGTWQQIHSITGDEIESDKYHAVPWLKDMTLSPLTDNGVQAACFAIRQSLTFAVKKRVHCTERPIAALLSGGIDSSLIAALVQRELKSEGRGPLETYSIGFEGSKRSLQAGIIQ
jgi:asparagine synthase (glutamine-hydrolysing)